MAAPAQGTTATAAPPPVMVDRRVPCPRCGEPAEAGQEVCLRCGALVGRSYRRPPSWRVPAALAALGVLLIGAGAGFGVAELTHDKDKDKKKPISLTPKPTTPTPVEPTAPTTTTAPTTPTQPTNPTTTTTTPTTPQTGGTTALATWPAGKTGWTVLLTTLPDRGQAEGRASSAAAQQISAGVLNGADYRGFKKNEWLVFMGQYESKAAAARAGKSYAKKGFPGEPRRIRPKK
jgi:cell division septation protein DedD